MSAQTFPPDTPSDKAKYRQFLINQGFDPNLDRDDISREYASRSDAERKQIDEQWADFVARN
jgi:hypothetical protein